MAWQYLFLTENAEEKIVGVQFTSENWTHHSAAYSFGVPNMYAPIGAVQFTAENWTHASEAGLSVFVGTIFPQGRAFCKP